jgi:hypothetical protein
MTTTVSRLLIATVLLSSVGLAGCSDEGGDAPSAEQLVMRETAWRYACAARELETSAADDVATLEASLESIDPADPMAAITRQATGAALEFGNAFYRHAELRTGAYANRDSAVNSATVSADSVRYVDRAESFTIRVPREGTVEANVLARYEERLTAILQNEDHRCNWDTPFASGR